MEGRESNQGDRDEPIRENVVRLRDWLAEDHEFVPVASRAEALDAEREREAARERERADTEPTLGAQDFWGEDAAALHDPIAVPTEQWREMDVTARDLRERRLASPRKRAPWAFPRKRRASASPRKRFLARARATPVRPAYVAAIAAVLVLVALTAFGLSGGGTGHVHQRAASSLASRLPARGVNSAIAEALKKQVRPTTTHSSRPHRPHPKPRHHAAAKKVRQHHAPVRARHASSSRVPATTVAATPTPSPSTSVPITPSPAPSTGTGQPVRSVAASSGAASQPAFGSSGSLGAGSSPDG